jgi:hypothetical protein
VSLGDVLEDVRLIIQSNPDRLNDFAARWAKVSGAAQGQTPVVTRAITDVEFDSQGQMAQQMTRFRLQMGDGMNALANGTNEVAMALRDIAPRVAKIRSDLMVAAAGAGITAVGALLTWAIPPVGAVVTVLGGGGELITIINLINDYNVEMTALGSAFATAEAKMQAVEDLNSTVGILPQAPTVTPG